MDAVPLVQLKLTGLAMADPTRTQTLAILFVEMVIQLAMKDVTMGTGKTMMGKVKSQ